MQLIPDQIAFSPERYDRLHLEYCKLDEKNIKLEAALKNSILYLEAVMKQRPEHKEPWTSLLAEAEEALKD